MNNPLIPSGGSQRLGSASPGSSMSRPGTSVHPERFREVLRNYPTGVVAVTATDAEGAPVGMILGTFSSVSLSPPLVSFLPARNSSSWARLSVLDGYCINVLGAHQEPICRALSSKRPDKFSGVEWTPSQLGAPALIGSLVRIDCFREQVIEAGDHHIVLCRVHAVEHGVAGEPLVFHRGSFGTFSDCRG